MLCRPYKDLEATTRAKGRPKDGRGNQASHLYLYADLSPTFIFLMEHSAWHQLTR